MLSYHTTQTAMHNLDKVRNAAVIFAGIYTGFRGHRKVISPRYPKYNKHLYILGRRVHHYESGLYLAALGLALFLEDYCDMKED